MANSSRYFTILDKDKLSKKQAFREASRSLVDDSELENIIGKVTKKLAEESDGSVTESIYEAPLSEQVMPDNGKKSIDSPFQPGYHKSKNNQTANKSSKASNSIATNPSGSVIMNDIENRLKQMLDNFLVVSRKQFVPDESDHKYQFARELAYLIKSESDSLPARAIREFASIFVYKGFDFAISAMKEYVRTKGKLR